MLYEVITVPMATRLGDFRKPEKMLFYTARTEEYRGEPVESVDRVFEASGDFVSAIFRVIRITSYNVCYTKLLRISYLPEVFGLTES